MIYFRKEQKKIFIILWIKKPVRESERRNADVFVAEC